MKMTATDWIAAYAALVSTIVFLWQLKQSRPQLKVLVVLGIEEDEVGAWISIHNLSSHELNLKGLAILYPWASVSFKRRLMGLLATRRWATRPGWVTKPLSVYEFAIPESVGPYNSRDLFIPEDRLRTMIQDASEPKMVVKVQDAVWKDHYSNEFHFSVMERLTIRADEAPDQSSD